MCVCMCVCVCVCVCVYTDEETEGWKCWDMLSDKAGFKSSRVSTAET